MRVQAIAQIHEHMYRSENLAQMSFSEHLRSLTSQVGQLVRRPTVDFELELADELILKVDRAIPCAMIVHELVVNALKHAFPGSRRGRVRVTCARESATLVKVVVEDDGIGMPERSGDAADGLGWTLIGALSRQLHGTLNIRRSPGTRVELCFSDELIPEQVGSRSERNGAEVGA
jgi:two-component sensor histidine kinase